VPRPRSRSSDSYPDDIFDNSRMSFGDHIEELRSRLIKALYGLGFCMMIGFVLDYVGGQIEMPSLGIGRPMMKIITEPAEAQVRAFYEVRNERARVKLAAGRPDLAEVERIKKKLRDNDGNTRSLTAEELEILRKAAEEMPVRIPVKAFEEAFGIKATDPEKKEIEVVLQVYPQYLHYLNNKGETLLENRQFMKTQSAQEAFMVYFKVSLLCGVVLGSPWIFYQLWAFIAAGLYPHEKRYVHLYLPTSVGLFVSGALLCQFLVLPGAVKALIAFNDWIDLDPDLRMNEWLGFALILPVVFGVSFQTPLVMFFLSRIRLLTYDVYLSYWRTAVFVLAVFAAVITPTPDVVTMMYLFVPMFGLYLIGVLVCYWFPPPKWDDEDDAEAQVAV
jgi:sec-independent protein translocase protein TatC